MKNGYTLPRRPGATPRRGFALIVTIVLVSFLVLILVGLATFTRVETQVADNSQQLAQARQNALMAMNLALGRLQATTGPDQRVTATADLQPRSSVSSLDDGASGEDLTGSASGSGNPLDKIDDFWRASRNRRWVGAWANGNTSAFDADNPADFNPEPELQAWLVSGNETEPDKYKPADTVPGLAFSAVNAADAASTLFTDTPADPDAPTARSYRLLVGKTTAGIATASDLDRVVTAPQIPLTSDSVPGLPGTQVVGHYAWWVGDEGVKAKVTVVDAYSSSPSDEDNRIRLQSAQRPVIEAISAPLESVYKPNDPMLENILSFDQLGFVNGNAADLRDIYRPLFHDLTVHSLGVLADSRRGGLKGDFSKILGQQNDTDARDDLRVVLDHSSLALSDNILTEETTIYARPPSTFSGSHYGLGLVHTPTWAQLRSFFNMGNTVGQSPAGVMTGASGTVAQARLQTQTTQGIGPILVQVKLFFGLEVDAANTISLKVRPLVVLANPYNINLTGTWWLRLNKPDLQLRMGDFPPDAPPPSYPESDDRDTLFPDATNLNGFSDKTKKYLNRLNIVIKDATLPPGRAVIFCLDRSYSDPGGSTSPLELELSPGLDELNTFTWNTGHTLATATPPAVRYVALYTGQSRVEARLYGADPDTNSGTEDNIVSTVFAQPAAADGACFLVPPLSTGSADGGGTWFVLRDSLRTDFSRFTRQMSPFIQFNIRALYNQNAGHGGTDNHVLEPARTYTQKNASNAPDAFKHDLLMDASAEFARWGPVTKGDVSSPTTPPSGVGADTGFQNVLFDIPRPDHPIVSFGQLQHFNPAGFIKDGKVGGTGDGKGFTVTTNTYQLTYPAANSYANPWMPRHLVLNAEGKAGIQYDASWLFNEALADRFFFSGYPASGGGAPGTHKFINARLKLRDRTVAGSDFLAGPRSPAKHLLLDGAFNINSTSVEAWKAVLSATRGVPVGGHPLPATPSVAFARTLYQPENHTGARDGASKEAWAGFSSLTNKVDGPVDDENDENDEIDKLAREIVLQIHRRGPFLSLADFYNRRLIARADDPSAFKLGVSGALQSAIDAILNQAADVDPTFRVQSSTSSLADPDYLMRTMTAGAPGYLLQGDVLTTLAPVLSARSDTFLIRAYGDAHNPVTGQTTAQAWCEAVVQRLPDYIVGKAAGGNDPEETPAPNSPNEKFGRRYAVVSFRWLSPDDI